MKERAAKISELSMQKNFLEGIMTAIDGKLDETDLERVIKMRDEIANELSEYLGYVYRLEL